MGAFIDLTGETFGYLKVINRAENHKKQTVWRCKCRCGNVVDVQVGHLRGGKIVSCGCYRKTNSKEKATIHGSRYTRLYQTWLSMRQRCTNPNNKDYPHYGGRGISISSKWSKFKDFEKWALANGYANTLTIERVDVNGNYCPENCTWIPKSEQAKNTTRTLNNRRNSK